MTSEYRSGQVMKGWFSSHVTCKNFEHFEMLPCKRKMKEKTQHYNDLCPCFRTSMQSVGLKMPFVIALDTAVFDDISFAFLKLQSTCFAYRMDDLIMQTECSTGILHTPTHTYWKTFVYINVHLCIQCWGDVEELFRGRHGFQRGEFYECSVLTFNHIAIPCFF